MLDGKNLIFGLVIFVFGCSPTPGPDKTIAGTVLGAGWGAGSGAIIGNQVNATGQGAAVGAGIGATAGMLTGVGLDRAEEAEIRQHREMDALRVQIASNERNLAALQHSLDSRATKLAKSTGSLQIFFDPKKASLRSGSAAQLEHMANFIKFDPYVKRINIHGHSDEMGDTEMNKRLSEARARTVATFLTSHGVSMDNMRIVAHGAERPLTTNETPEGRQLNRRVEIIVLR